MGPVNLNVSYFYLINIYPKNQNEILEVMGKYVLKSGDQLSSKSIFIWRTIQFLVWFVGLFILFCLLFYPTTGLHLFWNILIPIAPALLVVAVGVWRNVCPMGSTSLFSRHIGVSKRKKLTTVQTGRLNLISVIALFVIVPLRHVIFDTSGLATAILIIALGIVAIVAGMFYEWKSAWCSGLCPVHPVEKLYGLNNQLQLPNAHCTECYRCVTPCPDSTPGINPLSVKKTKYYKVSGFLMVGAFPGFIWGWFQVSDYSGPIGLEQVLTAYSYPLVGLIITSVLFLFFKKFFDVKVLSAVFSAAAVSCYYWFRIPSLLGFGVFPGDGMLVDLTGVLPEWMPIAIGVILTLFFFWWIVFRNKRLKSWSLRPSYAFK